MEKNNKIDYKSNLRLKIKKLKNFMLIMLDFCSSVFFHVFLLSFLADFNFLNLLLAIISGLFSYLINDYTLPLRLEIREKRKEKKSKRKYKKRLKERGVLMVEE